MVFRIVDSVIDVFHGIDQKNWRMDYVGISMIVRGILMLVAFVALLWLVDLLVAIIGMTVVTALVCFLFDIPKAKKLANFTTYATKQIISLLKRCFPLMLVLLIISMIPSFSRYSIERVHGTEALGVYNSVANPTLIVQLAAFPLFAPLANMFATCIKEGDKPKFIKLFTIASVAMVGITLACTFLSFFIGEWGLNILYGESIMEFSYLLPGTFVVSGLFAYIWFFNMVFSAVRDIKGVFIGNLIGAAICLATTDFFLNRFGVIGANHVMIISQGLVAVMLVFRLLWYVKNKQGLFVAQEE